MFELNKIYLGDSLNLMGGLQDNQVDLHIHSPPYAKLKDYGVCKGIHPNDYVGWYLPFAYEIHRTLKNEGVFILNINDCIVDGFRHPYVYELVTQLTNVIGFKMIERLFWNKGKSLCHPKRFRDAAEYIFVFAKSKDYYMNIDEMRVPYNPISVKRMKNPIKKRFSRTLENQEEAIYKDWKPNPKGALPSTILNIGSESKRISNVNFAVYPEKLMNYLIKGFSKEGNLVCDIFSGSGTTCVSAKMLGRNYIGFEIQPEAVKESIQRLNKI